MKELECGRILNTHGVRGELKIDPYCDMPILRKLETVYLDGVPYKMLTCRPHNTFALMTLEGITTVEQAQVLKNKTIIADRDAIQLPRGKYFYSDLYGFSVYDFRKQAVVGTLKEVKENPASMMYIVQGEEKEFMIPVVPAFDKGVDWEQKQVLVETIEGMLPDEN